MKLINNIILTAAGFLLLAPSVQAQQVAQDSLTLHQAIQAALTNQPSIEQVEAQIDAAEARVNQAETGFLPHVEAEGSYNYIAPVSAFNFNGSSLKVVPNNNFNAQVAARQLIYDFGKTRENIALARSKTLTSEQRMDVVKWTVSYFTAQTFYSVLYLDQSIQVVDEQLSTLNEDLDITRKKAENGTATDYDVLSIKVRIAEENNRKLDLINQKEKLNIRLRKLFGWAPDREVRLMGSLDLKTQEQVPELSQIYADRPDYKVLQQQKEELQHAYKLQGLSDRPTFSAGVAAGFKNGYHPDIKEMRGNYSIGVQLKVPIFNGHITRYQKQEVQANINSLEAESIKLQREIQEQLEQAKTDVQTGRQKLETADLQIQQAREQLRLAKVRYRNGVITNTDLFAAETALTRARFQKVTSTYNILLSQYDLKKAMGEKIWASND